MYDAILELRQLVTGFHSDRGLLRAVDGVDLTLRRGHTLALVGESGCGKSVTALSIMRLLPKDLATIASGEIHLDGTDLLALPADQMRQVRGNRISMIFQEPMTAMNPVLTIGWQIAEVLRIHRNFGKTRAQRAAIAMLDRVGIADAERRAAEYPFQYSGGMLQRAMIAMALACEPEVLIADEPTTALDVTIQAQILDLMAAMQAKSGTSILLITHDLAVVREFAHDIAIMYAGRIVEQGDSELVLSNPQHPYTRALLASIPTLDDDRSRPLASIDGLVPALHAMPLGCRFHPRCDAAEDLCRHENPTFTVCKSGQQAACHLVSGRIGGAASAAT